ncbi:MAG: hypothetical protein IKA71_08945, partial [Lentisphaeria bacterium]|nr:hypothetical protein [Lentisphaeria bacterium]
MSAQVNDAKIYGSDSEMPILISEVKSSDGTVFIESAEIGGDSAYVSESVSGAIDNSVLNGVNYTGSSKSLTNGSNAYICGGTFAENNFYSASSNFIYGGVIYNAEGASLTVTTMIDINGNTKGALFHNNSISSERTKSKTYGAAINNRGTVYINGATFSGNKVTASASGQPWGGAIFCDYNGSSLYLSDCTFDGNSSAYADGTTYFGGAIYLRGNKGDAISHCYITNEVKFLTSGDSIYVGKGCTLDFKDAEVVLNASVSIQDAAAITITNSTITFDNDTEIVMNGSGSLTFSGDDNTVVFSGETTVHLANLNATDVSITVDATDRNAGDVIATGVSGTLGADDIVTGNDEVRLAIDGTNLVLKEKATISDGAVIEQNFINEGSESLITGGEIKAVFVGTDRTSGNVNTEVQGGKFSKFFVGGALVKTGSAEMGTVVVTVSGGEFADRIYGAGYAYGIGDVDADTVATELHVAKSEVVLS